MTGSARGPEYADLFFRSTIRSYVSHDENPRFLRRDWLADEVAQRLDEATCRFLLLTAEPGAGKSTFTAQLASDHPDWPVYFIRRDQRQPLADAGARSFLMRVGYQLAATHPQLFSQEQVRLVVEQRLGSVAGSGEAVGAEVRRLLASPFHQKVIHIRQHVEQTAGAVTGLKIDELVIEPRLLSLEDLQHMALFDPARALQATHPGARIVILVDALDEVRYHGGKGSLLEWLTHCPELPSNVRFVLTSRPPDGPIELLKEKQLPILQQLTIDAGSTPVQRELRVYARSLAEEPDIAGILEDTEAGADGFVEEAVARAEGNIGYLDALARGVDQARTSNDPEGLRKLLTMQELPAHIEGLYAFFIRQIKGSVGEQGVRVQDHVLPIWDEVYWPILSVLSVAREPLLPDAIRRLGAIALEQGHVTGALDRLGQFLDRTDGRCRLYHTTLPEFLTAEATRLDPRTQDLAIQPATWHRRIADYYWEEDLPDWQKLQNALDGAYGLNNLAPHLFEGQDERLRALITEEWMTARLEGSGYTYHGFISDVILAWQEAHNEALLQIELGQAPATLAECVRYALIRTSLNSLADNYDPVLVSRALETGLWPAERVLEAALAIGKTRARAAALTALAPQLTGEARSRAIEAGLAAVLEIEYVQDRLEALAALTPQLTSEAFERGLKAALAIGKTRARAEALATLAPGLMGKAQTRALEEGLEAALAIQDEWDQRRVLVDLAPQLTGEVLERALDAVLTLPEERDRAEVMAALAPQLTDGALERALEAALAIRDEDDRAEALTALAPQLTGEVRTRTIEAALEAALAIREEDNRADALAALAPQLRGRMLKRGLKAALAIRDEWDRADALVGLAPRLTGKALQRALKAALALQDERARVEALAGLGLCLTGEALERALDAVLAIRDEGAQAEALTALAPQLTGELLQQGLAKMLLDTRRASALSTLAPHLTGEVLERGLEVALAIKPERPRGWALEALAPQLSGRMLKRGLEAALALPDEWSRARALAALAPQLTGKALERALEAALAIQDEGAQVAALTALAPQLTGEALERPLAAALALADEGARARALAALAPQLSGEASEQTLEAALAIGDEGARENVLKALAPQLAGEASERALKAALAIEQERPRAQVLVTLAPQLTAEALERALDAALAIRDERTRSWALQMLAPQLMGEALERALEAARAIRDEEAQSWVLQTLAQQPLLETARELGLLATLFALLVGALWVLYEWLTGKTRTRAVEGGLEAALDIWDEQDRAEALAQLAPQLTDEELERGLAAALAIEHERHRAMALAALASQLTGETQQEGLEVALRTARQAIANHLLNNLSAVEREWVLRFCADKRLFAPPLLDQNILSAIAQHVVEVCQEWRWM